MNQNTKDLLKTGENEGRFLDAKRNVTTCVYASRLSPLSELCTLLFSNWRVFFCFFSEVTAECILTNTSHCVVHGRFV